MTISDFERNCIFKVLNDPQFSSPPLNFMMQTPLLRVLSSAQATSSERHQAREALVRCVPNEKCADKFLDVGRMRRATVGDKNLDRVLKDPISGPAELRVVAAALKETGLDAGFVPRIVDGYRREVLLGIIEGPDSTRSESDEARRQLIQLVGDESYTIELIHSYRRIQKEKY